MKKKIPVVIDCDPGVDDAHALLLALASPELEVRAVTAVAGNMPVWMTADNALRVLELAGSDIPVSRGCPEALYRSAIPHSEMFHGRNGLGNAVLPEPVRKLTEETAVETLRREITAAGGELHIIALGPLTNIAMLIKLYPDVKEKIAHLTIMGGSQHGGNIKPEAEFNFFCDGEAADVVMRSGLPMTLVDLDGCSGAEFTAEDVDRLTAMPSRISGLLRQMWDFNLALSERTGESGFIIHDAITVASVIDPALVRADRCRVTVETGDTERYGKSIVTKCPDGNIQIVEYTDRARFMELCERTMNFYSI